MMKRCILGSYAAALFWLAHGFPSFDAETCDMFSDLSLLQARSVVEKTLQSGSPLWSQKNGDARHTGSSLFNATLNLAKPKWVYEEPGNAVLYNTPVLDDKGNVYMASIAGELFSVSVADGSLNWMVYMTGNYSYMYHNLPNPLILGDSLYVTDGNGTLFAFALADGSVEWSLQLADGQAGGDAWSLGGRDTTVLSTGRMKGEASDGGSGTWLFAISTASRQVLWKYRLPWKIYNVLPTIAGDNAIVGSASGALLCLCLTDGTLRWQTPENQKAGSFSTGGVAVGPNNFVYLTSNSGDIDGVVRAHYLSNGSVAWERLFVARGANAGPAVYPRPEGSLAVVIGIGKNLPFPFQQPLIDALVPNNSSYQVVALDANTGADFWVFQQPAFNSHSAVNSTFEKTCWPDSFSNAAVDARGTVYVGWYGGLLLAIDGQTGNKVAQYDFQSGIQGEPAIGDGVLVVASCNRMAAFLDA